MRNRIDGTKSNEPFTPKELEDAAAKMDELANDESLDIDDVGRANIRDGATVLRDIARRLRN